MPGPNAPANTTGRLSLSDTNPEIGDRITATIRDANGTEDLSCMWFVGNATVAQNVCEYIAGEEVFNRTLRVIASYTNRFGTHSLENSTQTVYYPLSPLQDLQNTVYAMYGVEELAHSSIRGEFNHSDLARFVVLEPCDNNSNCLDEADAHARKVFATFLDSGIKLFTAANFGVSYAYRDKEQKQAASYLTFDTLTDIQKRVNQSLIGVSLSFTESGFNHSALAEGGPLNDLLVVRGTGNDPSCRNPFSFVLINSSLQTSCHVTILNVTKYLTDDIEANYAADVANYRSAVKRAGNDTLIFVGGFNFEEIPDKVEAIVDTEPRLRFADYDFSERQAGSLGAACFRVHGSHRYLYSVPGTERKETIRGTSFATPNVFASLVVLWMAVKDVYGVELTGRQLSALFKSATVRSESPVEDFRLQGLGVADLRVLLERDAAGNVTYDSNGRTRLIPLADILERIEHYDCPL